MLKVLAGKFRALSGELIKPRKLRIGYFAQHQVDELDLDATPVALLQSVSRGSRENEGGEQEIRDFLGGFDFRGQRVDEPIHHFSGGEKARLALAKVAWSRPNLLLMDEPTNHLDLQMCHALTVALQDFQGALLVVSHDRHLLANTVDEFYTIHQGKFAEYKGALSDYESWLMREQSQSRASNDGDESPLRTDKKRQRQEAAMQRERLAPLRRQEADLERELERLQRDLSAIASRLGEADLYEEANKSELTELLRREGELKANIERTEVRWFEVQQRLAES